MSRWRRRREGPVPRVPGPVRGHLCHRCGGPAGAVFDGAVYECLSCWSRRGIGAPMVRTPQAPAPAPDRPAGEQGVLW